MDHLLYMPEFVDLMSSHLDLATLAACVRVCKAWHEICIPHLWHTFGTVPQQPLRFGNPRPPKIAPPRGTPFPLYVSSGNGSDYSPPTQIPVFSAARQEIYPWFYSNRSLVTDTMWDRFFGRYQPGVGDEEAIAAIVAKHARHIRCLVIRSQWAFGIYEHVCQQLTSLYFDTGYGDRDLYTADERIFLFIERQLNLQSIFMPQSSTALMLLSKLNRDWRHFDVPLRAQDFSIIQRLLPRTRTAQVSLSDGGNESKTLRLSCPHLHLRELMLYSPRFDHHMFKDILESFPNLRRLTVSSDLNANGMWVELDLLLDKGYSMLVVEEPSLKWDLSEVFQLLPNMLAFKGADNVDLNFETLARHCPRLMLCEFEESSDHHYPPFVPILLSEDEVVEVRRTSPYKSISRLLASCPNLVSVYSEHWSIGPEDLVSEPWVCHKLKNLECEFRDVPFLSNSEKEIYRLLSERRRDLTTACQQHSQSDSEFMSVNKKAVLRKAERLKMYIEAIEEQLQRIPEVDLSPTQSLYYESIDGSFLEQMEAAKASIQLQ